jgi:hypothetical protein
MRKTGRAYMQTSLLKRAAFTAAVILAAMVVFSPQSQKANTTKPPAVPKVWDDEEVASLEVPLADDSASPVPVSSEFYYRMHVRSIYKSYPVYAPGKEPTGYMEWLKSQEPVTVVDDSKLNTEADWIRAGEEVFQAPLFYDQLITVDDARNPLWYQHTRAPVAKDGSVPAMRYVIREKGKIELGNFSCAMCHTRVTPEGQVIYGAQGNFPFDRATGFTYRTHLFPQAAPVRRRLERALFDAPWVKPDPLAPLNTMSIEEIASAHDAIPPGVMARVGTSPFYPVQVPDIIGVQDRKYLDHTGLVRQRSIGDLMRYAALNQGLSDVTNYAGFIPMKLIWGKLPEPEQESFFGRYSDVQLYALAKYIYSLKPPTNPNKVDTLAARGEVVFRREGCVVCHTPPLYTNNKLTPVEGFKVPVDHPDKINILPLCIGTDPGLSLKTRRATGFYKVPSLKGVWYRGPFRHDGSVATLEDWFNPDRLKDDYVPTGFRGYNVKARAVRGHEFGLDLSEEDRKALIAFLKTL